MSPAGKAKAKEDVLASRAKPRPEGRVCERIWRPTGGYQEFSEKFMEAARRRATERALHAYIRNTESDRRAQ